MLIPGAALIAEMLAPPAAGLSHLPSRPLPRPFLRSVIRAGLVEMMVALFPLLLFPGTAHASRLHLPAGVEAEVKEGMRLLFNGDPDSTIAIAKKVQGELPEHPVGYLLEVNVLWWKIYC